VVALVVMSSAVVVLAAVVVVVVKVAVVPIRVPTRVIRGRHQQHVALLAHRIQQQLQERRGPSACEHICGRHRRPCHGQQRVSDGGFLVAWVTHASCDVESAWVGRWCVMMVVRCDSERTHVALC
jgi:hypothetical protein